MLNDLPDAPWIRDAENNGVDSMDDWECPVCHATTPEYFYVADNEVIGCECCMKEVEAWAWASEHPMGE